MGSGGGLGNPVVADGLKAPFKGVHTDELRLPLFRTGVTGEAVMGGPQDGMVGAVGEILKESRLLRALDLAYGADRGGNVRERPFAQGIAQGHAGAVHVQPYGGQPQRAEERRQFRSGVRGIKASRIGADIRNDAPFPASGPEGRAQDKGEPAFGEQDECEARMLVREREVHLRRVTHVVPAGQKERIAARALQFRLDLFKYGRIQVLLLGSVGNGLPFPGIKSRKPAIPARPGGRVAVPFPVAGRAGMAVRSSTGACSLSGRCGTL